MMSNVEPCTPEERDLLGVDEKSGGGGGPVADFPPRDAPAIFTDRIYLPPADVPRRSDGAVFISQEKLRWALGGLGSDPEQKRAARVRLLGQVGFDATRPYRVIEYADHGVYLFRIEDQTEALGPADTRLEAHRA
jgi:hypothetical protein